MGDAEEMLAVMINDGVVSPSAAKAILNLIIETRVAERKRCADAVRDEMPVWAGDEYGCGKEVACENIMDAIESGQ